MNRDNLMTQVKKEYARLASEESLQQANQTTSTIETTPEAYYENLLNMVLTEVSAGTFDNFHSGQEIVEAVANDKHRWLTQWK